MEHYEDRDRKASLDRLAPDLWTCADVLYVGARTDRIDFGEELRAANLRISILEVFGPNVDYLRKLDWLEAVYHGDVRSFPVPRRYDAVFWWHGPEHISEKDLPGALARLEERARRMVVLGCPWGKHGQGKLHDNPHERHVSHYDYPLFEELGYRVECLGQKGSVGSNLTAVKRIDPG
jgi:hypothetical protein